MVNFFRLILPITHKSILNILSQMLEAWSNISKALLPGLQPPPRNDTNSTNMIENSARSLDVERKVHVTREFLDSLAGDTLNVHHCGGGFRVLDSAAMILRVTRAMDSRLQNNADVDRYFDLLSEVSRSGLHTSSFKAATSTSELGDEYNQDEQNSSTQVSSSKTVICVEGLEGSGKSLLVSGIVAGLTDVVVMHGNSNPVVASVRELFADMPEIVLKAFEFSVNYIVAHDITLCTSNVCIVEGYYHASCAKAICDKTNSEAAVAQLPGSAFNWPFDLPQPELVVFLSVPTNTRLKRIHHMSAAKDIQQNPEHSLVSGADIDHPCWHIVESDKRPSSSTSTGSRSLGSKRNSSSTVYDRSTARLVARDAKANLVYAMVRGPGTVGIDASLPAEEVLTTTLEALEYFGVYPISRAYVYHPPPPPPMPVAAVSLAVATSAPAAAAVEATSTHTTAMSPSTTTTTPLSSRPTNGGFDDSGARVKKSRYSLSTATAHVQHTPPPSQMKGNSNSSNRVAHDHIDEEEDDNENYTRAIENQTSVFKTTEICTFESDFTSPSGGIFMGENDDPQCAHTGFGQSPLRPELPEELITNRRISMGVYGMFTKL